MAFPREPTPDFFFRGGGSGPLPKGLSNSPAVHSGDLQLHKLQPTPRSQVHYNNTTNNNKNNNNNNNQQYPRLQQLKVPLSARQSSLTVAATTTVAGPPPSNSSNSHNSNNNINNINNSSSIVNIIGGLHSAGGGGNFLRGLSNNSTGHLSSANATPRALFVATGAKTDRVNGGSPSNRQQRCRSTSPGSSQAIILQISKPEVPSEARTRGTSPDPQKAPTAAVPTVGQAVGPAQLLSRTWTAADGKTLLETGCSRWGRLSLPLQIVGASGQGSHGQSTGDLGSSNPASPPPKTNNTPPTNGPPSQSQSLDPSQPGTTSPATSRTATAVPSAPPSVSPRRTVTVTAVPAENGLPSARGPFLRARPIHTQTPRKLDSPLPRTTSAPAISPRLRLEAALRSERGQGLPSQGTLSSRSIQGKLGSATLGAPPPAAGSTAPLSCLQAVPTPRRTLPFDASKNISNSSYGTAPAPGTHTATIGGGQSRSCQRLSGLQNELSKVPSTYEDPPCVQASSSARPNGVTGLSTSSTTYAAETGGSVASDPGIWSSNGAVSARAQSLGASASAGPAVQSLRYNGRSTVRATAPFGRVTAVVANPNFGGTISNPSNLGGGIPNVGGATSNPSNFGGGNPSLGGPSADPSNLGGAKIGAGGSATWIMPPSGLASGKSPASVPGETFCTPQRLFASTSPRVLPTSAPTVGQQLPNETQLAQQLCQQAQPQKSQQQSQDSPHGLLSMQQSPSQTQSQPHLSQRSARVGEANPDSPAVQGVVPNNNSSSNNNNNKTLTASTDVEDNCLQTKSQGDNNNNTNSNTNSNNSTSKTSDPAFMRVVSPPYSGRATSYGRLSSEWLPSGVAGGEHSPRSTSAVPFTSRREYTSPVRTPAAAPLALPLCWHSVPVPGWYSPPPNMATGSNTVAHPTISNFPSTSAGNTAAVYQPASFQQSSCVAAATTSSGPPAPMPMMSQVGQKTTSSTATTTAMPRENSLHRTYVGAVPRIAPPPPSVSSTSVTAAPGAHNRATSYGSGQARLQGGRDHRPLEGLTSGGSLGKSPTRRHWLRDTPNGRSGTLPKSPLGMPPAPKTGDESLTTECVKIQRKLGRLANKTTLAL